MLPNIRMTDFRLQLFYNKVQQASKGMSHKMILDNLLCVCVTVVVLLNWG